MYPFIFPTQQQNWQIVIKSIHYPIFNFPTKLICYGVTEESYSKMKTYLTQSSNCAISV